MKRFQQIFKQKCSAIGMIHVGPLPGTPKYDGKWFETIEKVRHETNIYYRNNLDGILIENMHDVPYMQNYKIGYEVIAGMARICTEVKQVINNNLPCGVQILACGNTQALAIAKACNLQFIRAEGYVFGHIADEGYTDACAGQIMRYRRYIDGTNILVFTDIKKKHSSHTITSDVDLLETAKAAEFFISDGVILTGTSTGESANIEDLNAIYNKISIPILIGSGITIENLPTFFHQSNAVIIGSHFKSNKKWDGDLSELKVKNFMTSLQNLRDS